MAGSSDVVSKTLRALVESADRKFAHVRDLPPYGRSGTHNYCFVKAFKAYMRLWKYQQENRSKLVKAGLNRWEIGEIASRIGQLYFSQYMRTSEVRFLVEAYVFYEAILHRKYFGGDKAKDLGVRFKELRFYARFLLVSVILNRTEMVQVLTEKFEALVDESKSNFQETNFSEWKFVVQEIVHFKEVNSNFANVRPLRYCASFDSPSASCSCLARFHAKKVLKFQDAILTSYHQSEVKFAEITLDTYRMMQCLEWEPSGSFYQKQPAETMYRNHMVESNQNGSVIEHSAASGLIDINSSLDLTDPTSHPNPRKAVLYRPSLTQLLAAMATICEELRPESLMLIYLSASGKAGQRNISKMESSRGPRKPSKNKLVSVASSGMNCLAPEPESNVNRKEESTDYFDNYLWLGPKGDGGSNTLYPGDIVPFTRRPLFLIIDSDNSHAFKVLHGAEIGEAAALLLSPSRPVFKNPCIDTKHNGSQFTFFLTAPLQAFCQMVGLTSTDGDQDLYNNAEEILSTAFSEWVEMLCISDSLDLVWAQVLSDPFLRRLIVRFIFLRSVLSLFCASKDHEEYLPLCLPHLPSSVSPRSEVVQSIVIRLANHLEVADCFLFDSK